MGSMRTELEQMATIAGKIDSQAATFQTTLNRLIADLNEVTATWKGSAANQFGVVRDQIQTDGNKIHAQLAGIASMLKQSGSNYSNTNDNVANRFKHLTTRG